MKRRLSREQLSKKKQWEDKLYQRGEKSLNEALKKKEYAPNKISLKGIKLTPSPSSGSLKLTKEKY